MLIFAGVTLGLLADDWRQNRDTREAEAVALQDLTQDLLRDSVQLAQARVAARRWDQSALWALRADPRRTTRDEAAAQLATALSAAFYQPVASSYSSLKASGHLDLIQDAALRRQIVEYFEERQPTMASMNSICWDQFLQLTSAVWPYFRSSVPDSAVSRFPSQGTVASPGWRSFWDDDDARQSLDQLGETGSIWLYLMPAVFEANSRLRARILERVDLLGISDPSAS